MKCEMCSVILKNPNASICTFCLGQNIPSLIKNKCVLCQQQIKYSLNRYISRGNFCKSCNWKALERVRNKEWTKISPPWVDISEWNSSI